MIMYIIRNVFLYKNDRNKSRLLTLIIDDYKKLINGYIIPEKYHVFFKKVT